MNRNDSTDHTLDLDAPDPLTASQKAELSVLAALPEGEVDTSDIPALTEDFWKAAVQNPFYRPVKHQITVRLDADVLAWLQAAGGGYQTMLNDILRRAMLQDVRKG